LEQIILTPADMAGATGGFWSGDTATLALSGVGAFPGTIEKGFLAVAVTPRHWPNMKDDTHGRIPRMLERGAAAVMVERGWFETDAAKPGIPLLVVEDTYRALRALATASRDKSVAKRILVTGTEGKTGAKYALNALIGRQAPCYAQKTSANLTVPILFSLCALKPSTRFTIVEVSCPQPNRCTERSKLIAPDIAVITNLNISHMNTHGSIEKLIEHKFESLNGLGKEGILIVNRDTDLYGPFMKKLRAEKPWLRTLTYGRERECDARIVEQRFEHFGWDVTAEIGGERLTYRIPRIQEHLPLGSLAVLLTMKTLGLDIHKAAEDYGGSLPFFDSMGTLKRLEIDGGQLLFYDQHFSITETAMKSALRDVKRLKVPGRKIAVVSGELNSAEYAREVHERIATYLDDTDLDMLFTVGEHMETTVGALKKPECFRGHFFTAELLIEPLLALLRPGDLLFIKGMTKLNFRAISEAVQKRFPPIGESRYEK